MANIGIFKIDTNNEYVDLETITQASFVVDTDYNLQAINSPTTITCCVKSTTPNDGEGFQIFNGEKFGYSPESGKKLYVKSYGPGYLNIAEA